jgi:D-aminopeptidase
MTLLPFILWQRINMRFIIAVVFSTISLATIAQKPRARALGIPLDGKTGKYNAITDVPGVLVGSPQNHRRH